MSIKVDILLRVYAVFFCVCAFGAAIIVQAYRVQTVRPDHWIAKSDSVYIQPRPIDAQRGNIYSSDGRLLATTLPTFDIRMDLKADGLDDVTFRNNIVALSRKLAGQFPYRSASAWEQKLTRARNNGERYHLIQRRVDYRTMLKMKDWPIWERGQYKGGLIVIENSTRKTPFGKLAARTIGYAKKINQDSIEGVGLEASFHSELKGIEGRRLEQYIAGGTWVPVSGQNEIDPRNGRDVITTIDVNVQDVAESSLESVLKDNIADWGCAIVMEVETGKIKAIANLTRNADGSYSENYNYAIGYAGEPGSTMKLATLAALLEDGYVNIRDSVDLHNGKVRLAGRQITDSEGWHPYRNTTIKKAFERSSNVGFTTLAHKYYSAKPEQFLNHLSNFHFDKGFGVEVNGERQPFYRKPGDDGWSQMSVSSISFGYEITMTPLQMLAFYNAVANDGKMLKPFMVEAVRENGKVKKEFHPQVINQQIVSEETIQQLKESLVGVVEEGTGKSLRSSDYQAAGKTGTTRLAVPGASYGKYYTASFAGYFPADRPKYSCIVVVNKPTAGKYYGSSVAGPVFKSVADMLYARSLDIQSPVNIKDTLQYQNLFAGSANKVNTVESELFQKNIQERADWLNLENKDSLVNVQKIEMQKNAVPNVLNMGFDEALFLLENAGLKVVYKGQGIVKQQSLQPGYKHEKGQTIQLQLGV